MLELCNKHETDMKLMMDRLHIKSDDAFVKFKQSAMSNANQPTQGAPTNKQVQNLLSTKVKQCCIYFVGCHQTGQN